MMTRKLTSRLTNRCGYSMIEALVTIALSGALIGSALPQVDTRREQINTAVNAVVADLRYARARAITTGRHYALELTDTGGYELLRMEQNQSGAWVVEEVAKANVLPDHITLQLSESGGVEFNTRGMMISSPSTLTLTFNDTRFGATHEVSIWPSGQVYYEL